MKRGGGMEWGILGGEGEFREGDNKSGPNGGMLKIVCFCLEGGRGKRYVRGGGEEKQSFIWPGGIFLMGQGEGQESEQRTRKIHGKYNYKNAQLNYCCCMMLKKLQLLMLHSYTWRAAGSGDGDEQGGGCYSSGWSSEAWAEALELMMLWRTGCPQCWCCSWWAEAAATSEAAAVAAAARLVA